MTEDSMIGRELNGFTLQSRIGSGATGVVYRATKGDRTVAVKILNEALGHIHALRRRFEREARALGKLQHPNIVHIEDFGVVDDVVFIVMELLNGQTLEAVLQRHAIEPGRALSIMRSVLDAVGFAHEAEIVHRDLKPANVFLVHEDTPDGEVEKVKILDFGLAKFLSIDELSKEGTLTRRGRVVGTPAYMAPEQITGISLDLRADVYAGGVLLYELLADKRPFDYERRSQLLRAHLFEPIPTFAEACRGLVVDERLERVVRKALAKDPADRFPDAGAFRDALEEFDASAVEFTLSEPPERTRSSAGTSSVVIQPDEREALTSSDDVKVPNGDDKEKAEAKDSAEKRPRVSSDAPTEIDEEPPVHSRSSLPPEARKSAATSTSTFPPPGQGRSSPWLTAFVWLLGLLCLGGVGFAAWYATTLP
ncbi:MAG: protein kinase [Deltaproteobacteria bacterium]|nr:protein kinase [Deltaproteobacteria bacterium]